MKLAAKKISIIYQTVPNSVEFSVMDYYFKITQKFKMQTDLKTLVIGISPHEDKQIVRVYFYFNKKKWITRKDFFDFILTKQDYEAYTVKNHLTELESVLNMTHSKCWGNVGLKSNIEALHIEEEIKKGITPVMFLDLKDSRLRHLLYQSSTKIERFSKYKQLYNHLKYLREKNNIYFNIDKINILAKNPELGFSSNSLSQLIEVLSFLNNHNIPNKRHYKSKMLHIWSNEPGLGKSSVINLLKTASPCYKWPDDAWFDHYENYLYQWIIWDEFRLTGQNSEFLKRFFAGDQMRLPVKGSHAYKRDNPLLILTSNFSLETHVKRKVRDTFLRNIELKAFRERIHEIELKYPLINCDFNLWINFINQCIEILPIKS